MIDPTVATREEVTAAVGEWRRLREERLAADKIAEALKKEENVQKQFILSALIAQKYEGIVLDGRITGVSDKDQPVVKDRQAFEEYILRNKALHLLQFRISTAAVRELKDNDISVPGVDFETIHDLFDRKA